MHSSSPKTQLTTMTTADEVHATLPVGFARLIAAKGGVSRRTSLDLELTMAATLAATDGAFDPGALQGPCDGATHVVQSATFGSFRLTQASRGAVDGEVSSPGASASASSSEDKRTLAKEGNAAACEAPAGGSLARGCDATTVGGSSASAIRTSGVTLAACPCGPACASSSLSNAAPYAGTFDDQGRPTCRWRTSRRLGSRRGTRSSTGRGGASRR